MKLLVKGGRIIDPANGVDRVGDLLLVDGVIADSETADELPRESAGPDARTEVIDASGKIVCPGFIDLHAHFREPGYEYKEDITTGSRAASVGGFTTVCCMPNTDPVIDNGVVASFVRRRGQEAGLVDLLPIGCITKKQAGEELSEMGELARAGCVAFSDDGKPVMASHVMRNALDYSRIFRLPVFAHCEDLDLVRDGQMHEGRWSVAYGLKGIPAEAEDAMVARDIMLARMTRGRLHVCHVSTAGSIDLIRRAKAEGVSVTCEVTPHHLSLTDEIVGTYDTNTKVNPPLRSAEHVEALREALASGVVDCIATDHAPHHFESKDCEYALASSGISGIETAVAVVMDRLVHTGLLDIARMVQLFTVGPARVLEGCGAPGEASRSTDSDPRLRRGTLSPGAPADITIIDPDAVRTVDPGKFYSRGKNTPYAGMQLRGWPWMTIYRGKIVARDGALA